MLTSRGYFQYLGFAVVLSLIGCGGGSSSGPGSTGGSGGRAGAGTSGVQADGGTSADAGASVGGAGATDPEDDCDDNVLCTLDERVAGECHHTPQHFLCLGGAYCSLTKGCTLGDACAADGDCKRPDSCVTVKCDPKSARCSFHYVDTDGDGEAPLVCGGKDCDDSEFRVHSDAPETCDGLDNDCDGMLDPPKTSSCISSESCVLGKCVCDDGESSCKIGSDAEARVCTDLKKDVANCGACGHACGTLEICRNGACSCDAPFQSCSGSVCHDLSADAKNCGECGVDCGNATCNDGDCACPANTENCGSAQLFDCRDTQNDGSNCGECGASCTAGRGCAKGKCDAVVEYVRMYGKANLGTPTYGATVPLATDTKGNIFAALNTWGGDQYELPSGVVPVWTGTTVIAKLDAQAKVLWTVPSEVAVSAIASAGDDLWIAANASYDFAIGGKTFTRKLNHQNMVVLLKLKGSTGEILDQQQFDLQQSGGGIWLAADTDGAWAAFDTTGDVDHGASTIARPEGYYYLLVATSSSATRWLPGSPAQLTLDPNKKVFIAIQAEGTNVTLGGAPFTPTVRFGQWAIARYTKALVHEASHLMAADFKGNIAAPDAASVFWTNGTTGALQENDYKGVLLGAGVGGTPPFNLSWEKVQGNKVYALGTTLPAGGTFEGRVIPGNQVLFTRFDKATRKLESSLAFNTDKNSETTGFISSMVLTDNGAAAVLAVGYDDAISFTGGPSYEVTGKSGIAFMKIKLSTP